VFGAGGGTSSYREAEDADLLVMWGSNAREAHPIFFHHVLKGVRNGARLYAVDPRRTSTAQWADAWLGIDVGSDVSLANAIAREIIQAGLVNEAFVSRATTGFDAYAASVQPYTLDRAERDTGGVPADLIRQLAHDYARADRAQICWTLGITEHHNAADNVFALINLALLTGHVGRYGSGLVPRRGQNNVQGGGDMGAIPNKLTGFQRMGQIDPGSLGSYRAAGGYEMLRRAVAAGPQGVIRELADAKLLGRGGAAFPAGVKWEAVATNPVRPHYVVCNADESEPGTFKDRVLMEEDPYARLEALTIMGYTCGAEQGYIYIRGEYPLAEARLQHAVRQARSGGFLGADVMGAGFAFDIEVRRGAGAYIAGEETALVNSIEGKRAEPRNKPPFPAQAGLFGKPTAINNVETLLCVLEILRIGGPAFAEIGTDSSTGTRLFCLSGCVERPGLYEYKFGITLRQVIQAAGECAAGGRCGQCCSAARRARSPDRTRWTLRSRSRGCAPSARRWGPVSSLCSTTRWT
jgi:hypothetical protein